MKVETICPTCHESFRVDEDSLGRNGRCANCGTVFVLSTNDPATEGQLEFDAALRTLTGHAAIVGSTTRTTTAVRDNVTASAPQAGVSIGGFQLTLAQLMLLIAIFGAAAGTTGVFISNLTRPRTLIQPLNPNLQFAPGTMTGTAREFRGKRILPGQAIVLGFLDETAPVIAYEDQESFLIQGFDGSGRAIALKGGTIVELSPKLLVQSTEIITGSTADLTYKGTFALRYKYKGDETARNKLHQIEILEGPRKGQHWYVHEISLVQWDNVEEQQRHRDNSKREPGDLRIASFLNVQGDRFVYQTEPISPKAGF